jgi:hypothetical protein
MRSSEVQFVLDTNHDMIGAVRKAWSNYDVCSIRGDIRYQRKVHEMALAGSKPPRWGASIPPDLVVPIEALAPRKMRMSLASFCA